jgi:hypothetical protein
VDLDVNRYRDALRDALRGETKAYGFALVVWGTGELVSTEHGSPRVTGVAAFVGGVLAAMAVVVFGAFGGPPRTERRTAEQHFGFGGVHIVAVPAAIAVGWAIAAATTNRALAYLAAGFGASAAYQVLLAAELLLTRDRDDRERPPP